MLALVESIIHSIGISTCFVADLTCNFRDSENRLIDRKIAISNRERRNFANRSSTLYFCYDGIKYAASADPPYACTAFNPGTYAGVQTERSKIPQTGQNCSFNLWPSLVRLRGRISSSNGIALRTYSILSRSFRRKRSTSFTIVNRDCWTLSGLHNYASVSDRH